MSYNYGAGKLDRVKEAFLCQFTVCVSYATVFWVLVQLFPSFFAGIFTNEQALVDYTAWAMRIFLAGCFSVGFQNSCQQAFVALGQAKISLFMACLRKLILLIPLIFILPNFFQNKAMAVFLAEPVSVRLGPTAAGELLASRDMLAELGFEIEEFGDNTVLLRQIPMDLSPEDAAETLEALSDALLSGRREKPDTVRDELLHTVACKAAIKAGWKNDEKELLAVAAQVMAREDLKYCPHGRPICVSLSKKNLEKQFKRT